ncbi:hypothetical protein D3C71_1308220 [compost metagenome]
MDHVAKGHERGARLAVAQGFHGALLGKAGGTLAGVLVGDGARADDGTGAQRAGPGRMRDQLGEVELHVHPGLGRAEPGPVDVGHQRQVHLAVLPGLAQLIRGDEHRRQRRARLGLQEAEALGQFAGDQIAQRHVVDQADQLDVAGGLFRGHRHRDVVGDHHQLGFQIDAVFLADHLDRITRAVEAGAGGLVHQRVGVKALRHLGAAGAAHARHVRQVGTAVDELVGARQRRGQRLQVDVEHPVGTAVVERFGQRVQARRQVAPVFQRLLQGGGDAGGAHAVAQVARDHDQGAVAAAFLQRTELHGVGIRDRENRFQV